MMRSTVCIFQSVEPAERQLATADGRSASLSGQSQPCNDRRRHHGDARPAEVIYSNVQASARSMFEQCSERRRTFLARPRLLGWPAPISISTTRFGREVKQLGSTRVTTAIGGKRGHWRPEHFWKIVGLAVYSRV
jgi:hypothetical protein